MATTTSTSPRSSGDLPQVTLAAGALRQHVRWTTRHDGDFHLDHVPAGTLDRRRRAVVDLPATQLDEVHGTTVRIVEHPGHHDGAPGDAAVTACLDAALWVWVGDCAPVALASDGGAVGVVHAGWRGLLDGVLGAAVEQLRRLAPGTVRAVLGPSIRPCCYEFSPGDLSLFVDRFGPAVASRTSAGAPALDVPAAVELELGRLGVVLERRGECTGCRGDRYWSHRVRRELGRQAMVVWQGTVGR